MVVILLEGNFHVDIKGKAAHGLRMRVAAAATLSSSWAMFAFLVFVFADGVEASAERVSSIRRVGAATGNASSCEIAGNGSPTTAAAASNTCCSVAGVGVRATAVTSRTNNPVVTAANTTSAASGEVRAIITAARTSLPGAAAQVCVTTRSTCSGVAAPSATSTAVASIEVGASATIRIARLSDAAASGTSAGIRATVAAAAALNTSTCDAASGATSIHIVDGPHGMATHFPHHRLKMHHAHRHTCMKKPPQKAKQQCKRAAAEAGLSPLVQVPRQPY